MIGNDTVTKRLVRWVVALALMLALGGCGMMERLRGQASDPAAEMVAEPAQKAAAGAEGAEQAQAPEPVREEAPDMEVLAVPEVTELPAQEAVQILAPEPLDAQESADGQEREAETGAAPVSGAAAAAETNVFVIEVAPKDTDHPYFGKGSRLGFVLDGVPGKAIVVRRGETYIFRVRTNVQHDFYLSLKDVGWGSAVYSRGVEGQFTFKGDVLFSPDEHTPDTLYYECRNHQYMGGRIVVVDADADVAAVEARLAEERRAALAARDATAAAEVTPVQAKQKLAYVNMLFQVKAKALSAAEKQAVEAKLKKAEAAMAAQDYVQAYAEADAAGLLFAPAPKPPRKGPSEAELARQAEDYKLKLEAVHSFQKSHQRTFEQAQQPGSEIEPVDYDRAKVERLLEEADALAKQQRYRAGERKLNKAEREITLALNAMLGSRTIVFELKFDTPADEYRYEVDRYHSYRVLIPKAIELRKPSKGAIKLAQTYVDKGRFFAEKAEESAQAGRYEEAIVIVKDATKEVRRGLMILGVSM